MFKKTYYAPAGSCNIGRPNVPDEDPNASDEESSYKKMIGCPTENLNKRKRADSTESETIDENGEDLSLLDLEGLDNARRDTIQMITRSFNELQAMIAGQERWLNNLSKINKLINKLHNV
jgi:hypothetical protein